MKIATSLASLAAASVLALGAAQQQPQPPTNLRQGSQGQQGKGRSVVCDCVGGPYVW